MKNIVFTLTLVYLFFQICSLRHCNHTHLPQSDNKIEYIQNRNFDQYISMADDDVLPPKGIYEIEKVKYWRSIMYIFQLHKMYSSLIRLRLGKLYNHRWSTGIVVAELNSYYNKNITQTFAIPNEVKCDFSFQYSATDGTSNSTIPSGIEARVNGRVVLFIPKLTDYEVHTFSTKVDSVAGINKVDFADISKRTDSNRTVISQVSFKCSSDRRIQYINNRFFNESIAIPNNTFSTDTPSIPYWKSTGSKFKILIGDLFNRNWFQNWIVIVMDGGKNEVISQEFNVTKEMTCEFSFYYASVDYLALSTSGLEVKYNEVTLLSLKSLSTRDLQFFSASVVTKVGMNKISFTDLGISDSMGTTISGVSFLCSK